MLILIYLYLPLAAGAEATFNWGDPSNGEQFWYHVTGRQFRIWLFTGMEAFVEELGCSLEWIKRDEDPHGSCFVLGREKVVQEIVEVLNS